jgi:hypothetical protein
MDPCLGVKRLISRFHTLDYWPKLLIHHLLDPMYIVKNVSKSLLCHILGEKNTKASKVNLVTSNTKKSCWTPQPNAKGKMVYQVVPSTLQKK